MFEAGHYKLLLLCLNAASEMEQAYFIGNTQRNWDCQLHRMRLWWLVVSSSQHLLLLNPILPHSVTVSSTLVCFTRRQTLPLHFSLPSIHT